MNRRMVKAKAARKWHAARARQVQRFVAAAMDRLTDSLADSIRAHATLGDTMRDAARAVTGFIAATVAQRAVRQVMATLEPGQLFSRGPGGQLQHLGTTGPITVSVLQRCGTCRELIRPDALTGTRCGCTP